MKEKLKGVPDDTLLVLSFEAVSESPDSSCSRIAKINARRRQPYRENQRAAKAAVSMKFGTVTRPHFGLNRKERRATVSLMKRSPKLPEKSELHKRLTGLIGKARAHAEMRKELVEKVKAGAADDA